MKSLLLRTLVLIAVIAMLNFAIIGFIAQKYMTKTRQVNELRATTTTRLSVAPTRAVTPNKTIIYDEICPNRSNFLAGTIKIDIETAGMNYWVEADATPPPGNITNSTDMGPYRTLSGKYKDDLTAVDILHSPKYCKPTYNTAIIIPFRHREYHLRILLGHLTPIFRRQFSQYTIFVVEQYGNYTFNKGRLMNSGFEFARRIGKKIGHPYDCFVFQDVDLLTERDDLYYKCQEGHVVHHLSPAVDKFKYEPICCGVTVGGVLGFTEEQFRKVNGFTNSFWGWGGEDDDMNVRIRKQGLRIKRPNADIGRFTMIKHTRDAKNPKSTNMKEKLRISWQRAENDGLITLFTDIVEIHLYSLFTKVLVDVKTPGTSYVN